VPTFISGKDTRVIFAQPYYSGFQGSFTVTSGSPILTVTTTQQAEFSNNSIQDSRMVVGIGSLLSLEHFFDNGNFPYVTNVNGTTITMSEVATGSGAAVATGSNDDLVSGGNSGQSFDVSHFFNDVSISRAFEPQETTTFQTGAAKSYISGIKDGQISLSGFYDGSFDGVNAILQEATDSAYAKAYDPNYNPQVFGITQGQNLYQGAVVFPSGGSEGYAVPCYMAAGIVAKHDLKSPVSGVVAIDTEIQASGGVLRGMGAQADFQSNSHTAPLTFTMGAYTAVANSTGGTVIYGLTESGGGYWLDTGGIVSQDDWIPPVLLEFQHSNDGVTWITLNAVCSDQAAKIVKITSTIYKHTRLQVTLYPSNVDKPFTYAKTYYGFARH